MATTMQQSTAWALAARQHGVITRAQLLALGFTPAAIRHRLAKGRLHPIYPGVYAVGRPELSELGSFMAAVLSAGEGAALSHVSAAVLWRIVKRGDRSPIHVSTPRSRRGHQGIVIHRRTDLKTTRRHDIPVTTPAETLIDLAGCCKRDVLETAINEADYLGLVTPAQIRQALDATTRRPGVGTLRTLLDRATFVLTQTQLERLLVAIARRAGLGSR